MEHPITPPPELVRQWADMWYAANNNDSFSVHITTYAARWGADQELKAFCEWVSNELSPDIVDMVRAARRPKPPSLKDQALLQLDTLNADLAMHGRGCDLSQIRRALEQLND